MEVLVAMLKKIFKMHTPTQKTLYFEKPFELQLFFHNIPLISCVITEFTQSLFAAFLKSCFKLKNVTFVSFFNCLRRKKKIYCFKRSESYVSTIKIWQGFKNKNKAQRLFESTHKRNLIQSIFGPIVRRLQILSFMKIKLMLNYEYLPEETTS